jgi:DNA repair exonuclease
MKYTVVGDPHLRPDNLAKIGTLFRIIEELGNPVIVLGDTLDTKEVIRGRCLNSLHEQLQASKLKWIFLIGNHCWFNLECKEHSLEVLKNLPHVTIVDRPTRGFLGDVPTLMLPYIHDLEEFRKEITSWPAAKVLLMHQGVTGFDYGNGFIAENEIDLKELKKFKRVISGHFHKRQEKGNLVYPGTPFSHSFGESNQKKYLAVLDTDTLELEFGETPFPQHLTVDIDCDRDTTYLLKALIEDQPQHHVRAILHGSQEAINRLDKTQFQGVKFIERPSAGVETEVAVSETDSNEAKFQKWASEIKKLDSDTIQLGVDILREVQ